MKRRFIVWMGILLAIVALGELAGFLLASGGLAGVAMLVRWVARSAAVMWLAVTPTMWFEFKWSRSVILAVAGTLVAALVGWMCYSLGSTAGMISVAGIYAMAMAFYLGMWLVRFLLLPGTPVMGVARTLVNEAMRMKLPLVFIVALVLIVPILPFAMDSNELLRYRIQSFLSWSMLTVFTMLSLMTIFLAVGTVSSEMDRKRIYLSLTKPVSRFQYLLGKWLGIVLLDLVLVVVSGAGIYTFTEVLQSQPAQGWQDRSAVERQVLVARRTVSPTPTSHAVIESLFKEKLASARRAHPEIFGQPGQPDSSLSPSARRTIEQRAIREWYSLAPRGLHSYVFKGLGDVQSDTLQLQLKPESGASATFVFLAARVNGRWVHLSSTSPRLQAGGARIKLAAGDYHVLILPSTVIDKNGNLEIDLSNPPLPDGQNQGSINFNPKDGIQLLYQVGGFEGNLVRSLLVLWLRLAFLAMLGIAAATFLGFPIASLLCVMIYVTAAGSVYLHASITQYAAFPSAPSGLAAVAIFFQALLASLFSGNFGAAFSMTVAGIGSVFLKLVPAFGDYSPTPLLTDGRLVSWAMVGHTILWVGLIWTGLTAAIGYVIFRLREIARVTV